MTGRVYDAQSALLEFYLLVVRKLRVLAVFERVGVPPYSFIHLAHLRDLFGGHARALKQSPVLLVFQTTGAMARLPHVDEDLRVLRLVPQLLRQAAVILVRVREHDTPYVGDAQARAPETFLQSFGRLLRLRPRVNERDGFFGDEVDVNRPHVERRRQRDRDDLHKEK